MGVDGAASSAGPGSLGLAGPRWGSAVRWTRERGQHGLSPDLPTRWASTKNHITDSSPPRAPRSRGTAPAQGPWDFLHLRPSRGPSGLRHLTTALQRFLSLLPAVLSNLTHKVRFPQWLTTSQPLSLTPPTLRKPLAQRLLATPGGDPLQHRWGGR